MAALVVVTGRGTASAQSEGKITVGLYAPTAPFGGPEERLEFVTSVAQHLASAAGGKKVVGRAFARAGDFAAAVKKGEIQFAIVDAPYTAALGLPWTVLAAASRNGSTTAPWEIVVSGQGKTLADLAGLKIAVPTIGAKDTAFLANALLGGEVAADYFGAVSAAPDSLSAVTMVGLGRADAALVPGGLALPGGTKRMLTLRSVGWPLFVALPTADTTIASAFGTSIVGFRSSGAIFDRFNKATAADYGELVRAYAKIERRGPMAIPPPARFDVKAILAGRDFAIQESDVSTLLEAPPLPSGVP